MCGAHLRDGLRCLLKALSPSECGRGAQAPPRALRALVISLRHYSTMQAGWWGGWKNGWGARWATQRVGLDFFVRARLLGFTGPVEVRTWN